jgi:predicted RNase H-like nuclease
MFGDNAPVWHFLNRFDGPLNPLDGQSLSGVIETYPVLAMIALGWTLPDPARRVAGRLPKYNPAKKSKFSIQDWRHVCASASREFAKRGLTEIVKWFRDVSQKPRPDKKDQDGVDACICLIAAFYLIEGEECLMVGDQRTGYIVVPHDARLRSELEERCRRTGRIPTEWVQDVRWSSG